MSCRLNKPESVEGMRFVARRLGVVSCPCPCPCPGVVGPIPSPLVDDPAPAPACWSELLRATGGGLGLFALKDLHSNSFSCADRVASWTAESRSCVRAACCETRRLYRETRVARARAGSLSCSTSKTESETAARACSRSRSGGTRRDAAAAEDGDIFAGSHGKDQPGGRNSCLWRDKFARKSKFQLRSHARARVPYTRVGRQTIDERTTHPRPTLFPSLR